MTTDMTMTKAQRLSPQDWMQAGCRALARQGPPALKAEPLARQLGLTKGSFYWHFKDVPAFHSALLADWLDRYEAEIRTPGATSASPALRLRALAERLAQDGDGPEEARAQEPAIRAWAESNAAAARVIARADALKREHVTRSLDDIGVSNPEIAQLLLAAAIGMRQLPGGDADLRARTMGSLVDLVLALR